MTENKITPIEKAVFKKLSYSNYWEVLEEFECLKAKVTLSRQFTKGELARFYILLKYLMQRGHSESVRLFCKGLYYTLSEKGIL